MIRVRVAEQLHKKGWTAYRLAQESGLPIRAAYRLAQSDAAPRRLSLDSLDTLCRALGVQPGDLLKYVPSKGKRS
jgi:DNA-binding Xre family transcriptional regulator